MPAGYAASTNFQSTYSHQFDVEIRDLQVREATGQIAPSNIVNAANGCQLSIDMRAVGDAPGPILALNPAVQAEFWLESMGPSGELGPFAANGNLGPTGVLALTATVPGGVMAQNRVYKVSATLRVGAPTTPIGYGFIEGAPLQAV